MITKSSLTVVIDTNLFISAVIRGGTPGILLKAWKDNKFSLILNKKLFEEMFEVLNRASIRNKYNITFEYIQEFVDGIKLNAIFIPSLNTEDLPIHCRDPKDDIVLTAVIAGKADYLVTGDRDLLELNGNSFLGSSQIVNAGDFIRILNKL